MKSCMDSCGYDVQFMVRKDGGKKDCSECRANTVASESWTINKCNERASR